jgi:hypothetical protein
VGKQKRAFGELDSLETDRKKPSPEHNSRTWLRAGLYKKANRML